MSLIDLLSSSLYSSWWGLCVLNGLRFLGDCWDTIALYMVNKAVIAIGSGWRDLILRLDHVHVLRVLRSLRGVICTGSESLRSPIIRALIHYLRYSVVIFVVIVEPLKISLDMWIVNDMLGLR